jgi:hypothetical protein
MDLFARMGCDGFLEESQEVRTVAGGCALAEDLAGADVQGGEQVRGGVAAVVVGAFLSHVELDGQQGLGAVQGLDLDLGFFVETEHDSAAGRAQVEPDHIGDLLDERRVPC